MQVSLKDNLPFVTLTVTYQGQSISLPEVLIDTGSAHTVLAADAVAAIGIALEPNDILYNIREVGGTEVVFNGVH